MFTHRTIAHLHKSIAMRRIHTRAVLFLAVISSTVCAGCSSSSNDKFIPTESRAREALEAALTAWKDGKKPDEIEAAPIAVKVADAQWQAGKKLTDYEIVSQETDEGSPVFSVRLTIKGRPQPLSTRYYVVGKDPLWVYSEDSYKGKAGM